MQIVVHSPGFSDVGPLSADGPKFVSHIQSLR